MTTRILAAAAMAAALFTGNAAAATGWNVVRDQSRLGFTATQQGGEFDGQFRRFQAEMRFSADDLQHSRFDVSVDIASVDTGSRQRDRYLPGEQWFNTDQFPRATFQTTGFQHLDGDRFKADGKLTIKGHTRPITLPFTWTTEGDTARMAGDVTLDRTNYRVGTGEWSAGDTVGRKVTVHIRLKLEKATP